MASDYPSNLDPALPSLRDDVDTFRENGMQHMADMVTSVQSIVGTEFRDLTNLGGGSIKYGNLAQIFTALSRVATGEIDLTWSPSSMDEALGSPITTVSFPFGRFTRRPFMFIQTIDAEQVTGGGGSGWRMSKLFPSFVDRRRFALCGSPRLAANAVTSGLPIKAHWIAIEPPFGWANEDGDEG